VKTFVIDGNRFADIAGFYRELNRLFMAAEDWQLGESLDAFDDLLYGGFGEAAGESTITIRWCRFEKSRIDLGLDATRAYYLKKLQQPHRYQVETARRNLQELESGTGKTYFELLLQIIAEHPNVTLVPEP
jgi:RNAse (barnase) inhibitor barstar